MRRYIHFTGQVSCLPVMTSVWGASCSCSWPDWQCQLCALSASLHLLNPDWWMGEKKSRLSVLILIRLAHLSLLIGDDLPKLYCAYSLSVYNLNTSCNRALSMEQGDYDGSGRRSCKCNYVDFYKWALPPCWLLQVSPAPMLTQLGLWLASWLS